MYKNLSPIWQDMVIIIIGFLILFTGLAYDSESLFIFFVYVLGFIFIAFGFLELVYEMVKGISFSTGSALVKLFNIKLHAKRTGSIMSLVIKDAKEARGVSLLFLLLIFLIGFIVGKMM